MPTILVQLNQAEIFSSLPQADAKQIKANGHYFKLSKLPSNLQKIDPLIDVEISLRRGERVGLFVERYERKRKK